MSGGLDSVPAARRGGHCGNKARLRRLGAGELFQLPSPPHLLGGARRRLHQVGARGVSLCEKTCIRALEYLWVIENARAATAVAPGGGRKWRTKAALPKWTKKQAEARAHELERYAERGEATSADVETMTLADLCRWWLGHWCKPASMKRERSRLTVNIVNEPIGAYPLKRVTPEAVEQRLRAMEHAGAASASVEHVRRTLRRVFNCARKSKLWHANPAGDTPPRSMDSKRPPTTLAPGEVGRVIQAVAMPWKRDLIAIALGTAMRKGELLGLRKPSIDLERRTIVVSQSYERSSTKGGHTDTIPFPEWLSPFLRHARDASAGVLVFPAPGGGMRSQHTDAVAIIRTAMKAAGLVAAWDHVCRRKKCRKHGAPYAERHPERQEGLRCPRCGMRLWATAIPRPFRFHDLRHTAATLMIRAGGKPHEVQRILRHKSLDTTMRIYAHLFADDLRPVINLIPGAPPPPAEEPSGRELVGAIEERTAIAGSPAAEARVALLSHSARSVEGEGPDPRAKTAVESGLNWRAIQDSNLWPSAPEADALSN